MNPTKILQELRKELSAIAGQLNAAKVYGDVIVIDEESLLESLQKFEALDNWLVSGGFLPEDWKNCNE